MDYGALHLTSQKTGIKPKTQQSRFEGSDRQIRAQALRLLLKKGLTFHELQNILFVEDTRLQKIVEKMVKEQLIQINKKKYVLNE